MTVEMFDMAGAPLWRHRSGRSATNRALRTATGAAQPTAGASHQACCEAGNALCAKFSSAKWDNNQGIVFSISGIISFVAGVAVSNGCATILMKAGAGPQDRAASGDELQLFREAREAPAKALWSGAPGCCADQVGPARSGALAQTGDRAEVVYYANV